MGLGFSFSHRSKDIKNLWENLGSTGTDTFNAGNDVTNEGLGLLRSQYDTYGNRLADPLGPTGRSIFERARGGATDEATQRAGAFGSRIFQQARQSGGTLSPEAQAELTQQNQREINQDLFKTNADISSAEAAATLTETSKLFDRMDSISKTILGVGKDKTTMGLEALIQSILGRQNLKFGNFSAASNAVGTALGAARLGASGGGGAASGGPYG